MAARIRFEDMRGKALFHVDLKGKKLDPSDETADAFVQDWFNGKGEGASSSEFMTYFGNSENSGSFLYHKLVDSEDDQDDYPKS
jgi:hypothetical protein